jgi:hypothetical protein
VHRWQPGQRIDYFRRLTISKVFALLIVALILLPFTAPFRTYDLATAQSGSHDALPKDKVDADDKIATPAEGSLLPPSLSMVVVRPVARQNQVEQHPLHHSILRL